MRKICMIVCLLTFCLGVTLVGSCGMDPPCVPLEKGYCSKDDCPGGAGMKLCREDETWSSCSCDCSPQIDYSTVCEYLVTCQVDAGLDSTMCLDETSFVNYWFSNCSIDAKELYLCCMEDCQGRGCGGGSAGFEACQKVCCDQYCVEH